MSIRSDNFFKSKNEWSEIKDDLLRSYLEPYAMKILRTGKPLLYVDFFAGKGKFDDGKDGSPLIALKSLRHTLSVTHAAKPMVYAWFYDANHSSELAANIEANIEPHPYLHVQTACARYEEEIGHWDVPDGMNAFLYIDPFGIRHLNMEEFLAVDQHFDSVEVLLNLNSFGFIREACRFFRAELKDVGSIDDIPELERPEGIRGEAVGTWLDDVAGGTYWRDIISRYVDGEIDGREAEIEFAQCFCNKMHSGFKFVLNFPIRTRSANRPKYRMIHCCNHPDGCVLMYQRMSKEKSVWFNQRNNGQPSLFEQSAEEELIDMGIVKGDLLAHLNGYAEFTRIKQVLAPFLVEKGIICPEPELYRLLRQLEDEGSIDVRREPPMTKSLSSSRFWVEQQGKKVYLRGAQR